MFSRFCACDESKVHKTINELVEILIVGIFEDISALSLGCISTN
jgi:hypothetical protein